MIKPQAISNCFFFYSPAEIGMLNPSVRAMSHFDPLSPCRTYVLLTSVGLNHNRQQIEHGTPTHFDVELCLDLFNSFVRVLE